MSETQWPIAFVSAATAFGVGCVTLQQWFVAQDKLRLDLFEKRYLVYEATLDFLHHGAFQDVFGSKEIHEFLEKTARARFLFGDDVKSYLKTIRINAENLALYRRRMIEAGANDVNTLEEYNKILAWFEAELKRVTEVFNPYLSFENVRSDSRNPFSFGSR